MVATQIRSWMHDLRVVSCLTRSYTACLCYAYNWATNPARLLTDREHVAMRRFARYCRTRLEHRAGWREGESGRLEVIA